MMKQKFPTLAIYVAIICFLLGLAALTETIISNSDQHVQTQESSIQMNE